MNIHEIVQKSTARELLDFIEKNADEARAQINAPDANGFTPLMLALSAKPPDMEMITCLRNHGAQTPHPSVTAGAKTPLDSGFFERINRIFQDAAAALPPTPEIMRHSQRGDFEAVARLMRSGASGAPLEWTPLMRAVAIGTLDDARAALAEAAPDTYAAVDHADRTAWLIAVQTGSMAKAHLLRSAGAVPVAQPLNSLAPLGIALMRDDADMVDWLLANGESADSADATPAFPRTPLIHAVERDSLASVQRLLAAGANPNLAPPGHAQTPLRIARSLAVAKALLAAGADLQQAGPEVRRMLLDLTEDPARTSLKLGEAEFRAGMTARHGTGNPEEITTAYHVRMIQSGMTAYHALEEFKHLPGVDLSDFKHPVWCAERFGQSMTFLPDGRIVQIAGEHEDHYDANFCIYNDVIVHHPDRRIQVFGYPAETFPATDFHSATLVGDFIYLIGNLGYRNAHLPEHVPVYRLNIHSFAIERVAAEGNVQRRLYRHTAALMEDGVIRIAGGICGDRVFHFDTRSHSWSLVAGSLESDPHKVRLDQTEMSELVRKARETVDAYWEGRDPGGVNETNDPQHVLAADFFALYLAQHRLNGASTEALAAAFDMWSNLDGGSAQIDTHLAKIIPGDHAIRQVRGSVHAAYMHDGRSNAYDACFAGMLEQAGSGDARAYLIYDQLGQWIRSEEHEKVRAGCKQLLAANPPEHLAREARKRLEVLDSIGIGRPAPGFTRPALDSDEISLAKLRGRVVLLDFWATWCGPCINELPHLKRVAQANADEPFTMISISLDEDTDAARRMIRDKDMHWSHILEGRWNDEALSSTYGVMGIPQLFLIDAHGILRAKGLRGHAVDKAVATLLGEMKA